MSKIVYLRTDEPRPEDVNHVFVQRTPFGRYIASGSVAREYPVVEFYIPPQGDADDVITDALTWARQNGISYVHVRANV